MFWRFSRLRWIRLNIVESFLSEISSLFGMFLGWGFGEREKIKEKVFGVLLGEGFGCIVFRELIRFFFLGISI